jgi:glutamyl-tRNA synthetase
VLHLGNARSFLLAWLEARSAEGKLVLRVEDLDGPRTRGGAEEAILEDFAWLGLDWDEGPLRQRDRSAEYRAVLESWHRAGWVYPCICTRRDIEAAASAPHRADEGPVYPGTCRGRFPNAASAQEFSGRAPAWRFQVPAGTKVSIHDQIAGRVDFQVDTELGDFVVWKKDDEAAYQLAVVVDDVRSGINQVLRGDDLLPSAARQELLYRALQAPLPEWLHVPLVVGTDGRRLAKRHGDTSLRHLRNEGYSARDILQWCARVSGIALKSPPHSASDLLVGYRRDQLPRTPVVWQGTQDLSAP